MDLFSTILVVTGLLAVLAAVMGNWEATATSKLGNPNTAAPDTPGSEPTATSNAGCLFTTRRASFGIVPISGSPQFPGIDVDSTSPGLHPSSIVHFGPRHILRDLYLELDSFHRDTFGEDVGGGGMPEHAVLLDGTNHDSFMEKYWGSIRGEEGGMRMVFVRKEVLFERWAVIEGEEAGPESLLAYLIRTLGMDDGEDWVLLGDDGSEY